MPDISSETVSAAGTAIGALATVTAAIAFPVRWVLGLIRVEREARELADRELWDAVEKHRAEEVEYERRIGDKLEKVATKEDLATQTSQIVALLTIRTKVE